jgi:hypothetical protein
VPKAQKALVEAAESYVDELKRRFSGLEAEIIYQSVGGYNVYIRLGLPPELQEAYEAVSNAAIELGWRYQDERGVSIVAVVLDMEALSHAG